MIKKFAAGLALATVLAVPARAADAIEVVEPVLEPVVSSFSWTGAYLGVHVGYASIDTDTVAGAAGGPLGAVLPNGEIDPDGFMFGAHAGYNRQFGNGFVVGVEAEIAGMNVDGAADCPAVVFECSVDVNVHANATARLGYGFGRAMIYGEAGVSYIDADFQADPGMAANVESGSDSDTGWLIGVGAEYAATDRLIVKAEYNYADHELLFENSRPNGARITDYAMDADMHTIKVGLSFKF